MKKSVKQKGVVKGTGRAFVVAVLVHAGLFVLAGMLVVFTVIKKEEQVFEPPKAVERPKMKLKKPKVRVRKSSRPKSSARITTTRASLSAMPSIELPSMGGLGDGLGDGLGGFDLGVDDIQPSLFGEDISTGNDLVGTYYNTMYDRSKRPIPHSSYQLFDIVRRFLKSGWDKSILARYYQSPKNLYGSMIMVPTMFSFVAPQSFGEDSKDGGKNWIVHYKGQLVYPRDITFRFVGQGDLIVAVRVNGENVMAACTPAHQDKIMGGIWTAVSGDNRKWYVGNVGAVVGDWITLKANEPQEIEILLSDAGGLCTLMLAVQEKGVEYETRRGGGPLLPAFKTEYPSRSLQDLICRDMVPGEVSLTNGPIFNDLSAHPDSPSMAESDSGATKAPAGSVQTAPADPEPGLRTWTAADGSRELKAEFVSRVGDTVVLRDVRGKQRKIAFNTLSEGDREYITLCNPPELKVSVSHRQDEVYAYDEGVKVEVIGHDTIYTGKIRQTSAKLYPYELTAEFYAIGVQRYADTYLLLDRRESTFRLSKENGYAHEFSGEPVHLRKIIPRYWEKFDLTVRGEKHYGYLIVVKDRCGNIIAQKASANWIEEGYEKLRSFPVGCYMNKSIDRVFPEGPPRAYY